jgi:hypothetical protein
MVARRLSTLLAAGVFAFARVDCAAQHVDVMLQVVDGKIATGAADYDSGDWIIGQRVFERQLLSNFRANDPGFAALGTGNPLLGPGVAGFPSLHDVFFDLLPMNVEDVQANLFFWDGADLGGDGLNLDDVQFVVPPDGVTWNIFDDGFNVHTADGSDAFVQGGLIQQTSSDVDALDGIDTGTLHQHLLLRVDDGDGNTQTAPPQGVYMAALQARADGFATSDPFLFVHRTSLVSNAVRDLAAAWARDNYDLLFMPPALPGDYNADSSVDAADYVVWRNTLGSTTDLRANGDNLGASENLIDGADYVVWKSNFGTGQKSSPTLVTSFVVPEPVTVVTVFTAALSFMWRSLFARKSL